MINDCIVNCVQNGKSLIKSDVTNPDKLFPLPILAYRICVVNKTIH